ncbi:collagen alpha-1(XXV) chain-like [Stegostoma tigrinum]|uniref:collagen alpha-1(XXV) chain-like n=1 Tax=Stegostoma tigrinum TaxID=3053191 RepID=UPI00287065A0|nr:collagen alpha-1(XXV) chain-like [Stegostoma tigrinum]
MPKMSAERSPKRSGLKQQVEGVGLSQTSRCCWSLANALWLLLSAASLAFCVSLSVKTSQLEERILHLENGKGDTLPYRSPSSEADRMRLLAQDRVEQLLSQRSYEDAGKRRVAREAPTACNCPAGPPGKRGRRGRNGEPGPPVSTFAV